MHPAEPQDELLQCFDENGNPSEVRTRAEVKQDPPRWWYDTARVYVVNDKAQLMVSKRAEGLSGNPGKWQTYFGGHVGAGTTHKETAQRELEEEAGIKRPKEETKRRKFSLKITLYASMANLPIFTSLTTR